ncbi:MAG: DUF2147 domain-containing protein [Bacteroidota bacterium]
MSHLLLLLTTALLSYGPLAPSTSDKLLGKWTNEEKDRVLEFVQNGEAFEAIIKVGEPSSFVGQKQITELRSDGENSYRDGKLHVLKKGKTVNCSIALLDDDRLELQVKFGMKSKTTIWTRVAPQNKQ